MKNIFYKKEYIFKKVEERRDGFICKVDNYILKLYKKKCHPHFELNTKLEEIDPTQKYFIWYQLITPSFVLMSPLKILKNPKQLTKKQYRHLQYGTHLLFRYNISHGNLPYNVMIDLNTNLPVIIDFDYGKLNASKQDLEIDRIAFLTHFSYAR